MAAILPISGSPGQSSATSKMSANATPSEYYSAFQEILEMACSRVDALRNSHPDLDRRVVARRKIALPAECSGKWGVSRCLITDYGEGGIAIVCGHPHVVGEIIRVRWVFSKRELTAEVDCVVRHVTGTHVGIQFVSVSPRQRARLLVSLRYVADALSDAAA